MVYVVVDKHRDELPSSWELAEVHGSIHAPHKFVEHVRSGTLLAKPHRDRIHAMQSIQTDTTSLVYRK